MTLMRVQRHFTCQQDKLRNFSPGSNSLLQAHGYVRLMEVGLGSLIFMEQGLKFMKHCKNHGTGSEIRETGSKIHEMLLNFRLRYSWNRVPS